MEGRHIQRQSFKGVLVSLKVLCGHLTNLCRGAGEEYKGSKGDQLEDC